MRGPGGAINKTRLRWAIYRHLKEAHPREFERHFPVRVVKYLVPKAKTVNEAGRKGGQSRSAAKIAAGRRNAAKARAALLAKRNNKHS
jgi:hypothetical protein